MQGNKRLWLVMVLALLAALLSAVLVLSLSQIRPVRAQDASAQASAAAITARLAEISPKPAWITPDPAKVLTRIGFGSCLDQKKPQPIWTDIIKDKPDLFLMLGDNVYGDAKPPDMQALFDAYKVQAIQPELAAARAAMPFLAIWDDHDFGKNDAGGSFAGKRTAADAFFAFWQRQREPGRNDAMYYSRTIGPAGRHVQIIMLDTRFDRSDLTRKPADFPHWGPYGPDPDPAKQMIGPDQWTWLERELKAPADIRLLVSSTQVLAEGHGHERWGNFPRERERLLKLIADTGANGVILLSGDRHHAAIYRQSNGRYPLVEATSSALNLSYGPSKDGRIPPLVSDIYSAENYGLIDIDWAAGQVALQVKAIGGETKLRQSIAFAELGLKR